MPDVLRSVSTRKTPTSQPAGGATTKNAAGGFVFAIDAMAQLRRFLTLGTTGGTYYTKAEELTRQNAEVVIELAKANPVALVDEIVEISVAGRAPRQNPAIFALAIAASLSNDEGRAYALRALPQVCRIGTHMYLFAGYVEQFRGWGRGLRTAVANWYNGKELDRLTYQILKYRQREGWRHADLLALSHPNPNDPLRDNLYRYIVDTMTSRDQEKVAFIGRSHREHYRTWVGAGGPGSRRADELPALVNAFIEAQAATNAHAWGRLITDNPSLSWEMLPDAALTIPDVWVALLNAGMPQTALMRQLPRLTNLGLTTGTVGKSIAAQLCDAEKLKRGRVHPINVLVAQRTYGSGYSAKGDGHWTPTPQITDALDAAFYAAYGAVEPAGVPMLLACDVSGSMGTSVSGLPISCREATGALSLVTLNVESDAAVIGFSDGRPARMGGFGWDQAVCSPLDISPRRRLDDVCTYMANLNFGRTDCALPMVWAGQQKRDFSSIVILTDNETWYNRAGMHPWQALDHYRQQVGHDVRLTVVAMTATGTSIANPADPLQMDISGFDSNVPQVISHFSAGRI